MTTTRKRESIEMVDGRVFISDDNWQTIWVRKITDKQEADLVRFLAVCQSSAGPA